MIIDELAARSGWVRNLARSAHIVRVPFSVYPQEWDESERSLALHWKADRIPKGLVPRHEAPDGSQLYDAEFLRAPLGTLLLCSDHNEGGCLWAKFSPFEGAVQEARSFFDQHGEAASGMISREQFERSVSHWSLEGAKNYVTAYLIGRGDEALLPPEERAGAEMITVQLLDYMVTETAVGAGPLVQMLYEAKGDDLRAAVEAVMVRSLRLSLEANNLPAKAVKGLVIQKLAEWSHDSMERVAKCREGILLDMHHCLESIAATCGLMNCKNVRQEAHEPPPKLQRKRIRRGKLPLYRYHVLQVRAGGMASRSRREGGAPSDEHVAIHIVRGHFKRFTEERPLFGKHVGLYWWQPHIAGQARRVVEKEYQVVT